MDHDEFSCTQRYRGEARRSASSGTPRRGFSTATFATGNRKFVKHRNFSRAAESVRFAIREWPRAKRFHLHVFWCLITIALLAFLGPFGTWAFLTVSDRLLFWTTAVGTNWLVGYIAFSVVSRNFRARKWPAWVALVLAALVAALPGTSAVWLAVAVFLDYRPAGLSDTISLYTQVFVLHLIIGPLALRFIDRKLLREVADEESPPPNGSADAVSPAASEVALLTRLPARSRAELLHLRMQDHYVEVHTAAGSELLLLRFRDALHEVEGVDGLQVHRSHWVARDAVAKVERRRGGRVVLRLVNGSKVPVSRSFAPELRSKGWI